MRLLRLFGVHLQYSDEPSHLQKLDVPVQKFLERR